MSDSRIDWWPPMDGTQPNAGGGDGPVWGGAPAPEPPPQRRSRSRDRERAARERSAARRNTIVGVITAVVLLAGAVYVGFSLFGGKPDGGQASESVQDYPGPGYPSATVVVSPGDSGTAIAKSLVDAGVVATTKAFTDAFAANPDASKIQPGTYSLLLKMKASDAVVALLSPASRVSLKVTIPEGFTVQQIVAKVNEVTLIPTADLDAALADPAAIGLPEQAGGNAEGWLYPSTYQVDPKATAADVLKQMTAMTVQVLQSKQVPPESWKDVLTKASIVEREAGRAEDRPKMARAIENRLERGMRLEVDATVSYGLGKSGQAPTSAETQDGSNPYNTYQHDGLPPTPIASPGAESIDAVLSPADGTWLFWVTVNYDTKETKFATTFDEHNEQVAELTAWLASRSSAATTEPTG